MGYFEEVMDVIDNMTDEEFERLLIESGLENCPVIMESNITER